MAEALKARKKPAMVSGGVEGPGCQAVSRSGERWMVGTLETKKTLEEQEARGLQEGRQEGPGQDGGWDGVDSRDGRDGG